MDTGDTMDPRETLDPNKVRAIELLAQGLKMEEVARQVGVCSRTIQNWKQDKEFATRLHERFSYIRDDMQAAFNPILERIIGGAGKFLDRAFKMMDSDDDKVAKIGMQLYGPCLKWAGSRENIGRGSHIGLDGMDGRYQGYGKPENTGNMSRLYKMLRGFHPDTPDDEVEGAETGESSTQNSKLKIQNCSTEGARGEGPGVRTDDNTTQNSKLKIQNCSNGARGHPGTPISRSASEEQAEPETGNANVAQASSLRVPESDVESPDNARIGKPPETDGSPETGKNRKADRAVTEGVGGQGSGAGIDDNPTQNSTLKTQNCSNGPGGEVKTATGAPKPEKTGKPNSWKGKNPNHVPFYRKFQRR